MIRILIVCLLCLTFAAAIAAVRPYGVDASSRLERVRGEKDPGLVQAYVHAARAGFAALNGDG